MYGDYSLGISINKLIEVYNKTTFNSKFNFKELFFKYFYSYSMNKKLPFPDSLFLLKNLNKNHLFGKVNPQEYYKTLKKIKDSFPIEIKISNDTMGIIQALLAECLISLERSIYWFLNYRFNARNYFIIASRQAKYYSEFFALNSLSRLIGIANTHMPIVNLLTTIVNWEEETIDIIKSSKKTREGDHNYLYRILSENINRFQFISHKLKANISNNKNHFLSEDRVDSVYDFGSHSEVFRNPLYQNKWETYEHRYTLCFVNGYNLNYSGKSENFIDEEYKEWGYEEDYIGIIIREIIQNIKKFENSKSFINEFRKKIETTKKINENEKKPFLEWME